MTSNSGSPTLTNDFIVPHCTEDIKIIWQDESCMVITKPSGLLSVPGKHPANSDSVITRIRTHTTDTHIAHRLDMDTSGLMVIAKGKTALKHLNRQFAERRIKKSYIAVVYGLVKNAQGEIHLPLICDWPNRPKQKVDLVHGKQALTRYTVLSRDKKAQQSRLLLEPTTGRSHQLRVHLAEIAHPISGCEFYAHTDALKQSKRLLLHASALTFHHPIIEKPLAFENSPPF